MEGYPLGGFPDASDWDDWGWMRPGDGYSTHHWIRRVRRASVAEGGRRRCGVDAKTWLHQIYRSIIDRHDDWLDSSAGEGNQ